MPGLMRKEPSHEERSRHGPAMNSIKMRGENWKEKVEEPEEMPEGLWARRRARGGQPSGRRPDYYGSSCVLFLHTWFYLSPPSLVSAL